jgi:alkyl sulfatase BDS1-like metallo-beta-lactamase superfamily hydrolase
VVAKARGYSEHLTIDWHLSDLGERYRMTLSNGVLVHCPNPGPGDAELSFTLTKPQLLAVLAGGGLEGVEHQGDLGALGPDLRASPHAPVPMQDRPGRLLFGTGQRRG